MHSHSHVSQSPADQLTLSCINPLSFAQNLPGAPQRAQAPSAPPAAAESVPAPASSPTPKAAAGQETSKAPTPAAAAGLDDLN